MKNELMNISKSLKKLFHPTAEQIAFKARLMARYHNLPIPPTLTLSTVEELTGESIKAWKREEGFEDWICNPFEHQEKVELLYAKALAALDEQLENRDIKASAARMKAVSIVIELAGHGPKKDTTKDKSGGIADMNQEQLMRFLSEQGFDPSAISASNLVSLEQEKALEEEVVEVTE